jgi:hypothetical protein
MDRSTLRFLSIIFFFGFGSLLVYLGYHGYVVGHDYGHIPAQYLGFLLIAAGILGMFGVNVWRSGPLDRRLDEPEYDPAGDDFKY